MHEIKAEIAANVWQVVVEEGQMVAEGDEDLHPRVDEDGDPGDTPRFPVSYVNCTSSPTRPCKKVTSSPSSTSPERRMIRFRSPRFVGLATIDRPDRRNALNGELCVELADPSSSRTPSCVQFVMTGAGSAFCAGADLVTRFAPTESKHRRAGRHVPSGVRGVTRRDCRASSAGHRPRSTAPAMGAGMQLAVACDLRSPRRRPGLRFRSVGSACISAPANIWRLAVLAGQGAARDLLLAGRSVDADEARRLGIVQYLADDALESGAGIAGDIAASAPLAVRGHKRALNLVAEVQWLTADARAEVARVWRRPRSQVDDLQEGMAGVRRETHAQLQRQLSVNTRWGARARGRRRTGTAPPKTGITPDQPGDRVAPTTKSHHQSARRSRRSRPTAPTAIALFDSPCRPVRARRRGGGRTRLPSIRVGGR